MTINFKRENWRQLENYPRYTRRLFQNLFFWRAVSRPDILWSVNNLARAITKWSNACDRRLVRLISYIHCASGYRQYCRAGNTVSQCKLRLFQDADFTDDLTDSKSTSRGVPSIFGSHTFVPDLTVVLKQKWVLWTLVCVQMNSCIWLVGHKNSCFRTTSTGRCDMTIQKETVNVKEQQCEATQQGSRFLCHSFPPQGPFDGSFLESWSVWISLILGSTLDDSTWKFCFFSPFQNIPFRELMESHSELSLVIRLGFLYLHLAFIIRRCVNCIFFITRISCVFVCTLFSEHASGWRFEFWIFGNNSPTAHQNTRSSLKRVTTSACGFASLSTLHIITLDPPHLCVCFCSPSFLHSVFGVCCGDPDLVSGHGSPSSTPFYMAKSSTVSQTFKRVLLLVPLLWTHFHSFSFIFSFSAQASGSCRLFLLSSWSWSLLASKMTSAALRHRCSATLRGRL